MTTPTRTANNRRAVTTFPIGPPTDTPITNTNHPRTQDPGLAPDVIRELVNAVVADALVKLDQRGGAGRWPLALVSSVCVAGFVAIAVVDIWAGAQ